MSISRGKRYFAHLVIKKTLMILCGIDCLPGAIHTTFLGIEFQQKNVESESKACETSSQPVSFVRSRIHDWVLLGPLSDLEKRAEGVGIAR